MRAKRAEKISAKIIIMQKNRNLEIQDKRKQQLIQIFKKPPPPFIRDFIFGRGGFLNAYRL